MLYTDGTRSEYGYSTCTASTYILFVADQTKEEIVWTHNIIVDIWCELGNPNGCVSFVRTHDPMRKTQNLNPNTMGQNEKGFYDTL